MGKLFRIKGNDLDSYNLEAKVIFEKYNITHVLLSDDDLIKKYISKDENYKLIYEDSLYSLYERK